MVEQAVSFNTFAFINIRVFVCLFFALFGIEPTVSHVLGKCSISELHSQKTWDFSFGFSYEKLKFNLRFSKEMLQLRDSDSFNVLLTSRIFEFATSCLVVCEEFMKTRARIYIFVWIGCDFCRSPHKVGNSVRYHFHVRPKTGSQKIQEEPQLRVPAVDCWFREYAIL